MQVLSRNRDKRQSLEMMQKAFSTVNEEDMGKEEWGKGAGRICRSKAGVKTLSDQGSLVSTLLFSVQCSSIKL